MDPQALITYPQGPPPTGMLASRHITGLMPQPLALMPPHTSCRQCLAPGAQPGTLPGRPTAAGLAVTGAGACRAEARAPAPGGALPALQGEACAPETACPQPATARARAGGAHTPLAAAAGAQAGTPLAALRPATSWGAAAPGAPHRTSAQPLRAVTGAPTGARAAPARGSPPSDLMNAPAFRRCAPPLTGLPQTMSQYSLNAYQKSCTSAQPRVFQVFLLSIGIGLECLTADSSAGR